MIPVSYNYTIYVYMVRQQLALMVSTSSDKREVRRALRIIGQHVDQQLIN